MTINDKFPNELIWYWVECFHLVPLIKIIIIQIMKTIEKLTIIIIFPHVRSHCTRNFLFVFYDCQRFSFPDLNSNFINSAHAVFIFLFSSNLTMQTEMELILRINFLALFKFHQFTIPISVGKLVFFENIFFVKFDRDFWLDYLRDNPSLTKRSLHKLTLLIIMKQI